MDKLDELIKSAGKGDEASMVEIIQRFSPLIDKYSNKFRAIGYEDAKSELTLFLIGLIKYKSENISKLQEGAIVAYISKSMYRQYIQLSIKNCGIKSLEIPLDQDIALTDDDYEIENKILIEELLQQLSSSQRDLIEKIYFCGYSQSYLAKNLSVSRQAINKQKINAINKIKRYLLKVQGGD
jgi:DNA-directed RNA polymerase specialized sigma subunit, sigma24 homolog